MTDYLYAQLYEQLSLDYEIVEAPGPGVVRLRAAITEARGAKTVGNAVTTMIPPLRLLTAAADMATNTAMFAGRAAVEAEITDSMTGVRLAAGVDERVGTKTMRGGFKKWSHVKRVFEFWAKRL